MNGLGGEVYFAGHVGKVFAEWVVQWLRPEAFVRALFARFQGTGGQRARDGLLQAEIVVEDAAHQV